MQHKSMKVHVNNGFPILDTLSYKCSGSPNGRQNHHLQLSSGFWRLFSHVDCQSGESGRSVASISNGCLHGERNELYYTETEPNKFV